MQGTSLSEKVITACLIFVTAVSVCFLFWYQNFHESGQDPHLQHPALALTPSLLPDTDNSLD